LDFKISPLSIYLLVRDGSFAEGAGAIYIFMLQTIADDTQLLTASPVKSTIKVRVVPDAMMIPTIYVIDKLFMVM